MPKSKKERKYNFTKVKAKGREEKDNLITNIQTALEEFDHCYVFTFGTFRSSHMKEVRALFKDSRFFLGNNKVMQVALGRTQEESHLDNTYKLSPFLHGYCGLFFTNRQKKEIKDFFKTYSVGEYARMNDVSTMTYTIPKGPLSNMQFPVSMDPYLRKLGLNTKVEMGTIVIVEDKEVCTEGQPLSAEGSRLLKLFDQKMVEFRLTLSAHYSKASKSARRIKAGDDE